MCVREWSNKDLFANVLKKGTKTVGHVPHTMSCVDLFALPALGCNLSPRSYRKGKTQTVEVLIRLTDDHCILMHDVFILGNDKADYFSILWTKFSWKAVHLYNSTYHQCGKL